MPWARQTLAQLAAQITAGFQALLTGADTALRRSNLGVAAITTAAGLDGEYAYLDWIINNCLLPDSAIGAYADRWGALKGAQRKGPVAATGTVNFAGLVNTALPLGTVWQLQPGVTFATTAAASVGVGGTGSAPIAAILPSVSADGTQWNTGADAVLTLTQAIPGINGAGGTAAAISNGTAPESDAAFRARYLQLYSAPPQGGDQQDYVEWALEVPAVTRAWCVPLAMGAGSVVVYFMEDLAEAAFDGFPQGANGVATAETRATPATGDQLVLANYLFPLRPATALVYCFAPIAAPQNLTIKYVPAAQQAAVLAAITATLTAEGAPDGKTLVYLADIQNAVRGVPNCATALVTSPTDNISTALGTLPTLGVITWA